VIREKKNGEEFWAQHEMPGEKQAHKRKEGCLT
jgi:hypothetical protein